MLYIFVKNKMLEQLGYPNIYYRTYFLWKSFQLFFKKSKQYN